MTKDFVSLFRWCDKTEDFVLVCKVCVGCGVTKDFALVCRVVW